jgi:hypothetical protein
MADCGDCLWDCGELGFCPAEIEEENERLNAQEDRETSAEKAWFRAAETGNVRDLKKALRAL